MTTPQNLRATHTLVSEATTGEHPLVGRPPRHFPDQPVVETAFGLRMPALGLGTWELEPSEAQSMVRAALDLGYRHVDTAQMYDNESGVGAGIIDSGVDREEVFLTTKIADDHHEPDDLVRSVEASLERLGTDHVDLLLLHWPVHWDVVGATLSVMAQVQAAGLAHHLGVSNFTIEQLEQARNFAPLEVLQVECHPFFQQDELRAWCEDAGWAFTAYSPLARGQVLDSDLLCKIADSAGVSATAVSLAWLMALPQVTAIPRTADPVHLSANWAARNLNLSAEQIDSIGQLDGRTRLVDPDRAPW